MYMDETLNRMQDIMQEADKKVGAIYQEIKEQMEKEEKALRTNKSELKGQLQDLVDTEKYLKIIEERNREIEKEKMEGRPEYEQEKREEKAIYANRQTDIKINQEYLDKLGLSVPEEPVEDLAEEPVEKPVEKPKKLSPKPEIPAPVTVEDDDEELKQLEEQLRVNLDADYFKWKDEQEEQEAAEEKEKSAGFQNKIKNLIGGHPHDDSGV